MADIGDAYADIAYYEARNTSSVSVADASRLAEDLLAMSRAFDFECGLAPGTLNDVADVTLYLDGRGGVRLPFRDDAERLWLVRSITGIGIDSENDGTYDGVTLTLSDAWVVGYPANNAVVGKPYEGLELLTYLSTCTPSSWPKRPRAVRLQCTLGYETMPDQVKQVICAITRELRDEFGAGAAQDYQRLDESLPLTSQTWKQIARLKAEFSRRLPVVA